VFGGTGLEIAPRFLPVDAIPAFTAARRRIYMTATLADDGILVSHFQANADEIADPIRPKGAGNMMALTCRTLPVSFSLSTGCPRSSGCPNVSRWAFLTGQRVSFSQIQKLEQGMGRGVRSSEDHCVVLLLGAKLTQRLNLPAAREKFTAATRAQLDLGRQVTEQVRGRPLDELRAVVDLCLERNVDWVTTSRSAIASAPDSPASFVDPSMKNLRKAFDEARAGRFELACGAAQEAVNAVEDETAKGYYKQQLAEYTHHIDPVRSQEILRSAAGLNRRVIKPIAGITYTKLDAPQESQASASVTFMRRFLESNDLIVWLNALLEDLAWDPEATHRFEAAVQELGFFLGFGSQRPERQIGKGPDNLWAIGDLSYIIIECKSGATTDEISKKDCNQLTGSMSWFRNTYDSSCKATPVLIHPSFCFHNYCSPLGETRIIDADALLKIKERVRALGVALASERTYKDARRVAGLLEHYDLTGTKLVSRVTVPFKLAQ
jgi:hypothetical protein